MSVRQSLQSYADDNETQNNHYLKSQSLQSSRSERPNLVSSGIEYPPVQRSHMYQPPDKSSPDEQAQAYIVMVDDAGSSTEVTPVVAEKRRIVKEKSKFDAMNNLLDSQLDLLKN